LLHTAPDIAAAVNVVLVELGRAPIGEDVVAGYVGQGVDVLLHRVLTGDHHGRVDADLHLRARAFFDVAYADFNGRYATVYPGVREGLAAFAARGIRLGCVTNKPQVAADAVLRHFGLHAAFEFVLGGDALPQRKPQPEPLWHGAALLGASSQSCIALGDSANDAAAARAAGMPVVLVSYGYTEGRPIGEIDCDVVVDSFMELAAVLDGHVDARFAFLDRATRPTGSPT
jgi:phosphoglycolate phosphatase